MSLIFQNSFYVSLNVSSILYGVELMLYFQTLRELRKTREREHHWDKFCAFFSTALLALATVCEATQAIFGQEIWIVNATYPGGPAAYEAKYDSTWYQMMGLTAAVLLDMLTNGLLIYRCLILWNSRRVVFVPGFLWVVSLGLGTAATGELVVRASNAGLFVGLVQDIGLAYFTVTIALNVLVTCLICGRILWLARGLGGQATHPYFGVVAIIVESALPFSLCGVVFLVLYAVNSEVSIVFRASYVMFSCISPQMLILRVISGRAWTSASEGTSSALVFQSHLQVISVAANVCRENLEDTTVDIPKFVVSLSNVEEV
ncbi:hypothetical protein B0H21DRAFT_695281 [Amylocystis lapponica]|nr:hypothetical protein B0H21DRAFT_816263 [Amylocystis lapponica]KAH9943791.1 hypothetical protein B0H21DRAFT_695281 [Amylocystis lapponica]